MQLLCHVKGTRRKRASDKDGNRKEQTKSSKSSEKNAVIGSKKNLEANATAKKETSVQESFLDQIRLLKKEVQEAVDLKISSIFSQMNVHKNPHKGKEPLSPEKMDRSWHVPSQPTVPVPIFYPQTFQSTNRYQQTPTMYPLYPLQHTQNQQRWIPNQELYQAPVPQCPFPARQF